MSVKFFYDSNIVLYHFDRSAPDKRIIAGTLLEDGLRGEGCVSWQVVQECCNGMIRKFSPRMEPRDVNEYLESLLLPLCRVWPDEELYRDALLVQGDTGYSWYDSLIVSSALRAGCRTLYTEDLQHGRKYRGLAVINPFLQASFS